MKPEYDFSKARRGAVVPATPGKTRITIRLDNDIVHWFKARVNEAGGGNYQSLINEALKSHIQKRGLERALRKPIREELPRRIAVGAQPYGQPDPPAHAFNFASVRAARRLPQTLNVN